MPEILQGANAEARLLTDERFLRRIAYLYYEDGNSQEFIAELENCSRQAVGKALQKARERGIVRISVLPDVRSGYLRNLSRDLRVELGLDDVVLVAGRNLNEISAEDTLEDVVTDISTTASEYIDQLLTDDDIVAVSGGKRFMRGFVRHLKPTRLLPRLQVVATIGFVQPRTGYGDANLVAFDLAEAYGAEHVWFPCPAFFSDQQMLESVLQIPTIKLAHDLMSHASVVITSLFTNYKDPSLVNSGITSQAQLDVFDSYRPVVDINHWLFDVEGRCINHLIKPPPFYLSGLDFPGLKDRIQRGNTKVILIVGGSARYLPAIRAAIKARIISILITDHVTAQMLLIESR
jgi:DNA-binding transcriptional regulator LsrR (DeoR family)